MEYLNEEDGQKTIERIKEKFEFTKFEIDTEHRVVSLN